MLCAALMSLNILMMTWKYWDFKMNCFLNYNFRSHWFGVCEMNHAALKSQSQNYFIFVLYFNYLDILLLGPFFFFSCRLFFVGSWNGWTFSLQPCVIARKSDCTLGYIRPSTDTGRRMELCQGRVRWALRKGSSTECGGHGAGCPGQWSRPQAARVQAAFRQCSQKYGLIFGWSCVEPGVEADDPYGSLPIRVTYDSTILWLPLVLSLSTTERILIPSHLACGLSSLSLGLAVMSAQRRHHYTIS